MITQLKLRLQLVVLLASVSSLTAAERPNILFIMSDDHAAHAMVRMAYRSPR